MILLPRVRIFSRNVSLDIVAFCWNDQQPNSSCPGHPVRLTRREALHSVGAGNAGLCTGVEPEPVSPSRTCFLPGNHRRHYGSVVAVGIKMLRATRVVYHRQRIALTGGRLSGHRRGVVQRREGGEGSKYPLVHSKRSFHSGSDGPTGAAERTPERFEVADRQFARPRSGVIMPVDGACVGATACHRQLAGSRALAGAAGISPTCVAAETANR